MPTYIQIKKLVGKENDHMIEVLRYIAISVSSRSTVKLLMSFVRLSLVGMK